MLVLILETKTVETSGTPSEPFDDKTTGIVGSFVKTGCFGMQGIFLVVFD